jgi:hypothetical protein
MFDIGSTLPIRIQQVCGVVSPMSPVSSHETLVGVACPEL